MEYVYIVSEVSFNDYTHIEGIFSNEEAAIRFLKRYPIDTTYTRFVDVVKYEVDGYDFWSVACRSHSTGYKVEKELDREMNLKEGIFEIIK